MKRVKMVSSLLLALLMVLCFAPLASASADMAAAPPESTAQIVSKITYPVVSDTEQLIALARQQYYDDVRTQGKAAADAKEFTATELAGVTTYADGTVEMDYVSSTIFAFDEDFNPIPRAAAANPVVGNFSSRDIHIVHRMYWTRRVLGTGYEYRVTKVTTTVNDVGTDPAYVTQFTQVINCFDADVLTGDKPELLVYKTVTNPTSGTTYTFNNTSSTYYMESSGAIYNADCQSGLSQLKLSNGDVFHNVAFVYLDP